MARITISLPDNLHEQVLKIASKENESLSYTSARLIEIGVMLLSSKNKDTDKKSSAIEEFCQKLIIQINSIVKEIAISKFNFEDEKIAQITQDTLNKFNKLKGMNCD